MNPRFVVVGLAALLVTSACGPVPESRGPERGARQRAGPTEQMIEAAAVELDSLSNRFVPWYLEAHPVRATALGVLEHAGRFPDLSRTGVQDRIDALLNWLAELEEIRFDHLRDDARYDFAILEFGLRSELLELEEIRGWASDPGQYIAIIGEAVSAVAGSGLPEDERIDAMASLLDAAPGVLEAGRANVGSTPRLWAEQSVTDVRGLIAYLEAGLPAEMAGSSSGGADLPNALGDRRDRLVASLEDYGRWLETDVLPRSGGDFRLGRYLFERTLLYNEHVPVGVDALERLNQTTIQEYRGRVEEVAAEIDTTRTVRELMDSIMDVHPAPSELVAAARTRVTELRDWVAQSGVIELPEQPLPTVRESPAWARDRFAWLDHPGPFQDSVYGATLNLTNVLPTWSEAEQAEYLTYFNTPELIAVAAYHTYPGEYVRSGYERRVASQLRRIYAARSFADGWNHYAEQMVLDEGFRVDDPAVRLMQLRRVLQHQARWYAVVALHARGTPLEDVVARFMEIAWAEELPARRQVMQAARDPLLLSAALGRMQIAELRKDIQAKAEEDEEPFELAGFHHQLLELALPLPLSREIMLPIEPERPDSSRR